MWQAIPRLAREKPGFVEEVRERVRDRRADHGRRPRAARRQEGQLVELGRRQDRPRVPLPARRGRRRAPARATSPGSTTCPSGCCRRAPWPRRRRPRPRPARSCSTLAARSCGVATLDDLADYHRQGTTTCRPLVAELVEEGVLLPGDGRGLDEAGVRPPRRQGAAGGRRRGRCSARSTRSSGTATATSGCSTSTTASRSTCRRRSGSTATTCCRTCSATASSGRVDLKADRAAGVLRVQGAYVEPGVDAVDGGRPARRGAAADGRLAGARRGRHDRRVASSPRRCSATASPTVDGRRRPVIRAGRRYARPVSAEPEPRPGDEEDEPPAVDPPVDLSVARAR